MSQKTNRLSTQIFVIAIPIIIQGLTQQVQILVNRAFLGQVSSEYFSAVGNVIFPYFTTIAIMMAVSIGTTVIIAQNLGAAKKNSDPKLC
ncbi:MAG TPA: MATE family efflux transporter [Bacillota bacterium]|nr:MATE family efflux transporter [Bacillota bacterium]